METRMTYPATTYAEGVELTITSGNQLHEIMNGSATEEVDTDSGTVPSVRKALADAMLFKPAIAWSQGSVESDPFQTRLYVGGIYWAPSASNETPISMGENPNTDDNWFLAPVTGLDSVASNTNLLSNHNFLTPSTDNITQPSATPTNYASGTQIFSGVYVGTDITDLTYINGRVSFTSGDFFFTILNTNGLEYVTEFVASVADFDGSPRTRGVSFSLIGDEYRVTVGVDALEDESANATLLGSVKFEQGSVATGHEVGGAKSQLNVSGRMYYLTGASIDQDGTYFVDDAISIVKGGLLYQMPIRDRKYQYIHISQLNHEHGTDASSFIDVAAQAGFIVDISGWELILDGGYELSTVIYGRGVIKQASGDDGVIVKTGGGFQGFVTVDGEITSGVYADIKRPIRFNLNSLKPFAHDLTIKNYHSSTFINALMIDNQGVKDFEIRRLTVENIKADANGVIGDADGVCRGINFASRSGEPTDVSNGTIDGFTGKDFSEWEDCDGIAIQAFVAGDTVTADVTISNVKTRNVLKRSVKIQANEVSVNRVDARSNNAKAMYSVVSCYGEGCKISNIRGRGAINSGVDVLGYAEVNDVNIFSDSIFEPGAALLILGGACDAVSITGNGMESVVSVRSVSAPVLKVNLSSISGSSSGVPLWIRPDNSNNIDLVIYSNVDVTCTTSGLYAITNDTSGTGTLKTVIIGGEVICFNDHFYNIFLNGITERAEIKDARFDGDSVGGAKVIGGEVFIGNVSSNKSLTVELENTTKAFVNGVEGTLKLVNTDNSDVAMYQTLTQSGTNTDLRTVSWL